MIVVRVDLESEIRVRVDADEFSEDRGLLTLYKNSEEVAVFRNWAYMLKLDSELPGPDPTAVQAQVTPPNLSIPVLPANYQPLGVKAPQ